MTKNKKTIAYKFVKWDVPALGTLRLSKVYYLKEKVNAGEKLSRDDRNWITEKVNNNAYFKSAVPLGGYCFDFSEVLHTYIVKQYGAYHEYRATDRTSLRTIIYGRIEKIIEVK